MTTWKAAASIPAALAGAGNALLVNGAAECVLARCTQRWIAFLPWSPLGGANQAGELG